MTHKIEDFDDTGLTISAGNDLTIYSPPVGEAETDQGESASEQREALAAMQMIAEQLREKALANPITLLIQDFPKPSTQKNYRLSLSAFFVHLGFGPQPSPAAVRAFVSLDAHQLALLLGDYRAAMLRQKLSAATVNSRLAAIRSLLAYCKKNGLAQTDARGLVKNEKVRAYRDTRGPAAETVHRILALPDRETLRGKRDYAILRLLCDNGLRRAEVCSLRVADFDTHENRLEIFGKGQTDREWIEAAPATARALAEYLAAAGHVDGPLFRSCDRRPEYAGGALTGDALHDMIQDYGQRIGIKRLTPHKFRHYAITWLSGKVDGNLILIQQFTRHARIETVRKYVDNARNQQGRLSRLLAEQHGD